MIDELEEEQEQDQDQEVLEPFTAERFICAQSMGMLWPGVVAEGTRQAILYPGQAKDVVIFHWLCSLPSNSSDKKTWSVQRASDNPEGAMKEAMRWAAEEGISQPGSPKFWQAVERFTDAILEIKRSYTEPKDRKAESPNH